MEDRRHRWEPVRGTVYRCDRCGALAYDESGVRDPDLMLHHASRRQVDRRCDVELARQILES